MALHSWLNPGTERGDGLDHGVELGGDPGSSSRILGDYTSFLGKFGPNVGGGSMDGPRFQTATRQRGSHHQLMGITFYQEDSNEARHAFTELCRFGVALSQRFKPTSETIPMIHSLSHRGTVRLPTEAIEILDGPELRRGEGQRTRRAKAGTPYLQGDSI